MKKAEFKDYMQNFETMNEEGVLKPEQALDVIGVVLKNVAASAKKDKKDPEPKPEAEKKAPPKKKKDEPKPEKTSSKKAASKKKKEEKKAKDEVPKKGKGKNKKEKATKKKEAYTAYKIKQDGEFYYCFPDNRMTKKAEKVLEKIGAPHDDDMACVYLSCDDLTEKNLVSIFEKSGVELTIEKMKEKAFIKMSLAEPEPEAAEETETEPEETEPEDDGDGFDEGDDFGEEEPGVPEVPEVDPTDDDDEW